METRLAHNLKYAESGIAKHRWISIARWRSTTKSTQQREVTMTIHEKAEERKMGWEVAREVEATKTTMGERAKLEWKTIRHMVYYGLSFVVLFGLSIWLAGNPFESTQRIASEYVTKHGLLGTDTWSIVWYVVFMCAIFEFMDSAGGMGYGTALTPLLLMSGFDPRQVVPLIMITEMFTGLIAGLVHGEFENVEWKFKPMNEVTKMTLVVSILGMASAGISISAVYGFFQVHKFWIKLYVAMLLIVMGACSLFTYQKNYQYRPKWMWIFATRSGFNKNIGGDGTVIAAVGAPYVTRIFSEKFWKIIVPLYCCILAGYAFYKLWPDISKRLLGA
jgi:uncharacterized protein